LTSDLRLGIAIANRYSQASVTLSDYPDNGIISALNENVARNDLASRITVKPLDWNDISGLKRYDSIVAADTLWNSQLHLPFCQTLKAGLHPIAKAHLLAGLHTGRYTLQHFISVTQSLGFVIHKLMEYHISGRETRGWQVEREGESSDDRVHWLLYIRLSLA
jgi:EEF1A N-terminal glycine/lysine methyltransferase